MISPPKVGDKVKTRVGKGYSTGKVYEVNEGKVYIVTDKGYRVIRKVESIEKV